jgi:hypothetical protein
MSVLIHEQSGRRTIYYPDDRHLRQYAVSGPTVISIQICSDDAQVRAGFSLGRQQDQPLCVTILPQPMI